MIHIEILFKKKTSHPKIQWKVILKFPCRLKVINAMNFKLRSSVFCLTLASLVALTICDSGPAASSDNTRESPATIAFNPPDNAQRVERSPKYDFGLGKRE